MRKSQASFQGRFPSHSFRRQPMTGPIRRQPSDAPWRVRLWLISSTAMRDRGASAEKWKTMRIKKKQCTRTTTSCLSYLIDKEESRAKVIWLRQHFSSQAAFGRCKKSGCKASLPLAGCGNAIVSELECSVTVRNRNKTCVQKIARSRRAKV